MKYRRPIIIAITLFLLPFALQAHILEDDVNAIVKKTKELYNKTTSAKINFSQSGSGGTVSGTLEYSTGNKFRLTLPTQTIVSNGTKTWTYIKDRNQVVVNKAASGGQITPKDILQSFPGDYTSTLNGNATVNGKSCWIVECSAGGANKVGDISSATLYIDKSSYRFQKISVTSPTLGTMTLTISSASYNKTIASSRFSFTAPKGAKVIDLTK
ncbi:MAG: outer membrane lipoprotein carrier protein LolA [Candidatus Kapaibacterium sp.]